jgi:hypothetical protein
MRSFVTPAILRPSQPTPQTSLHQVNSQNQQSSGFSGTSDPFSVAALVSRPLPAYNSVQNEARPLLPSIATLNVLAPLSSTPPNNWQKPIPKPEIVVPKVLQPKETSSRAIGTESGKVAVRCVCGSSEIEGFMVQCNVCQFSLHGLCVNVAYIGANDKYECPYCRGQALNCKCGQLKKYDEPIVQCMHCQLWSHKGCEGLEYGIIPNNFTCTACGGAIYSFPHVIFAPSFPDRFCVFEGDRDDLLNLLPDGSLRREIASDLNFPELRFQATMQKYFHMFLPLFFESPHSFWRTFLATLSTLLMCDRLDIIRALDHLTMRLLYDLSLRSGVKGSKLEHSEALKEYMEKTAIPRVERQPLGIELEKGENGVIRTPVDLDNGQFIMELTGLLVHTDEVNANHGLNLSYLSVTDSELVLCLFDDFARGLKRSFQFNSIVKLVKVNGVLKVGLFATKIKGPLGEERNRKVSAIAKGSEIVVPFDGVLPYDVPKVEWKDKKQKPKVTIEMEPKSPEDNNNRRGRDFKNGKRGGKQGTSTRSAAVMELSLLSSFMEDGVPPMPFTLLPDQRAVDRYLMCQSVKARARDSKRKIETDEED